MSSYALFENHPLSNAQTTLNRVLLLIDTAMFGFECISEYTLCLYDIGFSNRFSLRIAIVVKLWKIIQKIRASIV